MANNDNNYGVELHSFCTPFYAVRSSNHRHVNYKSKKEKA